LFVFFGSFIGSCNCQLPIFTFCLFFFCLFLILWCTPLCVPQMLHGVSTMSLFLFCVSRKSRIEKKRRVQLTSH
jgi:hypothetical protein